MGLDNGIYIKTKNKILFKILKKGSYGFEKILKDNNKKSIEYYVEICYWRKHWNLRNKIINELGYLKNNLADYNLSLEDIKIIIDILKSKEYFEKNFFPEEEIKKTAKKDIKKLELIYFFKKHYPPLNVYFYDSY